MKGKGWLFILLGVLVLVALVGLGVARGRRGKVQAVQFARVRLEDITARVRAPGKIEPRTQVKISADIMGKIVHLAVKEGDHVARGQLMLQLDDTQYRSAYNQAEAMLSSARSRLKDAQAAQKLAEATYVRQTSLWEQKVLSQQEWDQANNAIDNARNAVTTAGEEVTRATAALAGAADNLAKTRFLAPFDGVVSALNVEQGEIVITGTMNNPGTEILTVSDLSRMLVRADVDETDVVDMKLGQKAKITVDALPDTSFEGTVVEIGNTAKRTVATTGEGQTNFEVKVVFDSQVAAVRPGMTADVEVETSTHPQTSGVPIQAVVVRTERELKQAGGRQERGRQERCRQDCGCPAAQAAQGLRARRRGRHGGTQGQGDHRRVPGQGRGGHVRHGAHRNRQRDRHRGIRRAQARRPGGGRSLQGAAGAQTQRPGQAGGRHRQRPQVSAPC